ncbi:UNVERIFIED_CONTAM: hypothetical protein GTU68_062838 [Idotea baltica]|nr:hypothetical protein [Idotea baltica]
MAAEKLSFEDLKLSRQFLNAIDDLGYTDPTPIQQKAIPRAMAGHDLLGIAQTGTGKTAAFVLPILMKVKYAQGDHPRALIMAPTRELVMQIKANLDGLAAYTDLRIVALYGGLGPKQQIEALEKGVDIIVSTPGRFLDIYKKGLILTKQIKIMVLDEADKMMDMGFMPQIKSMLEIMPRKRQNMLFSATMPDKVVTARGMDISMVSHVINFDVPLIYEDYVHRIGRTGRANNTGVAITFANEVEMIHIGRIEKIIRKPIPRKEMPEKVVVEKTPFEEKQLIDREIDLIKRREDPDFKGAFHEKKRNMDKKRKFSPSKGKSKRKGRR